MNSPNSSPRSENSIDTLLKELEERLNVHSSDKINHSKKSKKGINFARFTQSQVIGGLTLILLLVGAVTGVYLGEQPQDIRQQAYAGIICENGASADCLGQPDGSSCNDAQGAGGPNGTCVNVPIFGVPSAACFCDADPLPTTPLDNGCSAKNGTCVAPGGSCPVNRHQDGLCSGAGSGPICCVPNIVIATSTPFPTATDLPQPTSTLAPDEPTYTPQPPQNTDIPVNTIQPTQVIAPLCTNVTVSNPSTGNAAGAESSNSLNIDDQITLKCATVASANRYEFRMKLPNGVIDSIDPSVANITISQQYRIATGGIHVAQCRPCIGTVCANWMD